MKALVGPKWVLRGCEVCHGDLYAEADWPNEITDHYDVYVCVMCSREHIRPKGTTTLPSLGFDTDGEQVDERRPKLIRGIHIVGEMVFLAEVPEDLALVHQLASSLWFKKLKDQGLVLEHFDSWPVVSNDNITGLMLCGTRDGVRFVANVPVQVNEDTIDWRKVS